jgi:hypothetical protein
VAELDRLGLTHARSPSTAAWCPGRPPKPWLGSHPPGRSSPVGPSRAPAAPAGAWPATAPAARAASATANAAMAAPQPPARPPWPADLDRLGGPGLQPRHPRHPGCLTGPRPDCARLQRQPTATRRPHAHPFIRGK